MIIKSKYIVLIFIYISLNGIVFSQDKTRSRSIFRDSLDNAYDMSDFLLNKKGIMIVPSLITEPAVGYGIAGAAMFFHSSYSEKNGPPSISGMLGGITQNGTWAAGVFKIYQLFSFRNTYRY